MKILSRTIFALGLFIAATISAHAQSSPNWTYRYVPTVAEWNAAFASKQNVLASPPLLLSGGTLTGPLVTAPATALQSGLNVAPGVAPTTPFDGDVWSTAVGLYVRINGATVGPLAGTGGPNTWTGQQVVQGLTTTQPGWYAQVTGDAVPRTRFGLNATDTPSLSFGPGNVGRDTFFQRKGPATFRFGGDDAASPIAQAFTVQDVLAGTTNTAGADQTFKGSLGTGTGVGGGFIFQTAPAGGSGSAQNALANALHIFGNGGVTVGNIASGGSGTLVALSGLGIGTATLPDPFTVSRPNAAMRIVDSTNTTGVQIQGFFPAFNMNSYYDYIGAIRYIGTGYESQLTMNPSTGLVALTQSAASGTAGNAVGSAVVTLTAAPSGAIGVPAGTLTLGSPGGGAVTGPGNINIAGNYYANGVLLSGSGTVTNVTITAGTGLGSTGTCSSGSAVNCTLNITSPIPASIGGTGVVSPATHTIPVNQGSSAQANTGTGTIGQCLGSNGASADPTFKSGCWVLLNTLTASGSSNLQDITNFTSTYNEYEIVFHNLLPTTNTVGCNITLHSGGSFITTNYASLASGSASSGYAEVNTTTSIPCSLGANIANTNNGVIGSIMFRGFNNANWKSYDGRVSYKASSTVNAAVANIGGFWFGGSAFDGISVQMSSGTIASGVVEIYGRI